MTTLTLYPPPIACWTEYPGGSTPVTLVQHGFLTVQRTDTARRRRPKGIDLLRQATAASTDISWRKDEAISYRDGKNTVHTSVCSIVTAGYGGEVLPSREVQIRNRLLAQCRNISVNLANTLAEYQQCASMFAGACKSLVGLLEALHSRNPWVIKRYLFSGSTKGFGKIVSKRILEFQYGVKPLIDDINGSIAVLKRRSERSPIYRKVSATMTDNLRRVIAGYDSTYNPPILVADRYVDTVKKVTSAWGIVTLNRDVLNRSLGQFGFTNPVATVYEIVPFSFVLDWWFNVGEFLQSLDNSLYFDGASALSQTTVRESYKREAKANTGKAEYVHNTIRRGNVVGLGTLATLRFKPEISNTHIVNGLALITQTLSNFRK